jgi:protein SCO1
VPKEQTKAAPQRMRPDNNARRARVRAPVTTVTLLAASLTLIGCGTTHHTTTNSAATKRLAPAVQLRGLIPQPLPQKPNFTLTDTAGHPFDFTTQTRGKLTYLYFGYTHCPDACPLTMGDIASALRRTPASIRSRIAVVFVTVDPRRDTAPILRTWLNHFGTSFVGLRGNESQIRAAEQAAGVPVTPTQKHQHGNYAVQHSSLVLPYSPDNQAHVVYLQGSHTSDYAHDMPLLVQY